MISRERILANVDDSHELNRYQLWLFGLDMAVRFDDDASYDIIGASAASILQGPAGTGKLVADPGPGRDARSRPEV